MTRIASVATHMISVPRPQPVWTAHEESKAWNVILTEVRTDDGLVGYGEIHGAPMPRIPALAQAPSFGGEWAPRAAETAPLVLPRPTTARMRPPRRQSIGAKLGRSLSRAEPKARAGGAGKEARSSGTRPFPECVRRAPRAGHHGQRDQAGDDPRPASLPSSSFQDAKLLKRGHPII